MTSCSTTYYQLYKTVPSTDMAQKNGYLVYEDNNCQISYDLWSEQGNIGFRFYNKINKDIYLNLGESYYVRNGIANDYYKNRVFSSSGGKVSVVTIYGISAGSTNNASTAQKEKDVICIPSMTSKIISEYLITENVYRDCNLWRYPQGRQIKTVKFDKNNSPLVFSNRLTYLVENMDIPVILINEFYVTEITNYPEKDFLDKNYEEICGEKRVVITHSHKDVSPDKFYIKYKKLDEWKH